MLDTNKLAKPPIFKQELHQPDS